MSSCSSDAECNTTEGFSCHWPCEPAKAAIAANDLEALSPYEQTQALDQQLNCCYAWGSAPDAAFSADGFYIPGLSASGMQRGKAVKTRFYFAELGEDCPSGSWVPLEYCMPQSYATEVGKCRSTGYPNYDQVSMESPSDGVAFNNTFRDILLTDSAFDFGHRRSCDPSYHDKHFRIERNLVEGGNNKVIGMSHPSNGVSLINNLFFSSPGYAYHAWWKMRMLHNSRLWVTTDEVTPWYPQKTEQRRQMTAWEIGNHPDVTSCPNDVDEFGNALSEAEKAQKSDICSTYEHGFLYLNETSRFDHQASGSGLSVFLWNYNAGTFNSSDDAPNELVYRGVLFALESVGLWFAALYDENDLSFNGSEYCGFDENFTSDTTVYAPTSGTTSPVTSLPDDVYLAAAAFDPSSSVGADPELLQWLAGNPGESIEPASVCEAGSVQCSSTAAGFQPMITIARDWYGLPRDVEFPTRGAFEYPDAICSLASCASGFETTSCGGP